MTQYRYQLERYRGRSTHPVIPRERNTLLVIPRERSTHLVIPRERQRPWESIIVRQRLPRA